MVLDIKLYNDLQNLIGDRYRSYLCEYGLGKPKGVCDEMFGEILVYQHCELDHRNKSLLHLIKKRVALSLSCTIGGIGSRRQQNEDGSQ